MSHKPFLFSLYVEGFVLNIILVYRLEKIASSKWDIVKVYESLSETTKIILIATKKGLSLTCNAFMDQKDMKDN